MHIYVDSFTTSKDVPIDRKTFLLIILGVIRALREPGAMGDLFCLRGILLSGLVALGNLGNLAGATSGLPSLHGHPIIIFLDLRQDFDLKL